MLAPTVGVVVLVALILAGLVLVGLLIPGRLRRLSRPARPPRHEPLPPTGRRRPGPLHVSASEIAVSRQEHGRRLPGHRW